MKKYVIEMTYTKEVDEWLKDVGMSMENMLRNSLRFYLFVRKELDKGSLLFVEKRGDRRLVIVPQWSVYEVKTGIKNVS